MSSKRPKRKRAAQATPGWIWMLFGLSIGLVVAAAIYFSDRRAPVSEVARTSPAPTAGRPEAVTRPATRPETAAETEPHPATRFDFYDMLPQFEVVVPETVPGSSPARTATAVEEEGNYVLQAGSFRALTDADRMKANLALLGIESRIERVPIDEDIYHRVRIGPMDDLDELNRIRRRLWDADIEVLLLRVPN